MSGRALALPTRTKIRILAGVLCIAIVTGRGRALLTRMTLCHTLLFYTLCSFSLNGSFVSTSGKLQGAIFAHGGACACLRQRLGEIRLQDRISSEAVSEILRCVRGKVV